MADGKKIMIQNRKARHEYFVEDTIEAGLALFGTEVKSIRKGKANLQDSYISVKQGEAFIWGMHISPYEQGNIFNRDPLRERKLLLHKQEIRYLAEQAARMGYTLIPLSIYFKNNRVKVEVGICRGKKLYDRRESLKQRDDEREMQRAFRDKNRASD